MLCLRGVLDVQLTVIVKNRALHIEHGPWCSAVYHCHCKKSVACCKEPLRPSLSVVIKRDSIISTKYTHGLWDWCCILVAYMKVCLPGGLKVISTMDRCVIIDGSRLNKVLIK